MKRLRLVVLHASGGANASVSYQHGWPRALARDARFDVVAVNLARRGAGTALRARSRLLERADAIVMLHSIYSNERAVPPALAARIAQARPPKVFFVGNEYKLMPEKIAFAEETRVELLVSQLGSWAAHELYRERLGCAVVGIPNTGFDPKLFFPQRRRDDRPIDLGYRAFTSPRYLGHDERRELVDRVLSAAARHGLSTDISLDPSDRFDEPAWADFLNQCRGQIGSEAGGERFELTDETRQAVIDYEIAHPDATLADIRAEFFEGRPPAPSGRALSGRIVEAAATKTVQILLEGEYGGFFQAGVHYLALRHDYANLDEVLRRLRDDAECERIAEAAHEVAHTELTYERLVDRLYDALLRVVDL